MWLCEIPESKHENQKGLVEFVNQVEQLYFQRLPVLGEREP